MYGIEGSNNSDNVIYTLLTFADFVVHEITSVSGKLEMFPFVMDMFNETTLDAWYRLLRHQAAIFLTFLFFHKAFLYFLKLCFKR